jgi:hypothetical protein
VLEETGLVSVVNESQSRFFPHSTCVLHGASSIPLTPDFVIEDFVWVGQFIGPSYHYTVIDFIAWVNFPHGIHSSTELQQI